MWDETFEFTDDARRLRVPLIFDVFDEELGGSAAAIKLGMSRLDVGTLLSHVTAASAEPRLYQLPVFVYQAPLVPAPRASCGLRASALGLSGRGAFPCVRRRQRSTRGAW